MGQASYDPLYLRGVDEFNRQNYFRSHEVKIKLQPSPEEDNVGI